MLLGSVEEEARDTESSWRNLDLRESNSSMTPCLDLWTGKEWGVWVGGGVGGKYSIAHYCSPETHNLR